MLKTKFILACLLTGSASIAFGSVYTGVSAGYLIDGEEAIVAGQLGYKFGEDQEIQYELEIEIGYTEDSANGVSVEIIPIMANYKIPFNMAQSLDGYAGAGIGTSNVEGSGFGISITDDVFTYQLLFGMRYSLNERTSINLGYRYIRLTDVFDQDDIDDSVLEAGIRFSF